jgi:hypothetical protein
MRAQEVPSGAVVRQDETGEYYQAPGITGVRGWSKMQLLPFFGPPEATAPEGELTLMVPEAGDPAAGGGEQ